MTDLTERNCELERVRASVHEHGYCEICLHDLGPLCPDHLNASELFACIAEIAAEHGWSFAFLPNRSVLFRPLAAQG